MKNKLKYYLLTALCGGLLNASASALSCGDLIFSNVTLTTDLHCTTGFYALEVFADNVTVDLNGYTLSGTSSLGGIAINDHNNVTIKNGVIKDFWVGVNTSDVNSLKVYDSVFYNLGEGVIVSAGSHADIRGNDFIKTSSRGVAILNHIAGKVAMDNVVADNEFYMTRIGVEICGSGTADNTIKSNLIWQSMDYGISLEGSVDNQIYDNTVLETGYTALRMNDSSSNIVTGNSLRVGDVGLAIYADAGSRCLSSGVNESRFNHFSGNHSIGFNTGVILGLGTSSTARVYKNEVIFNKIYDDNTGIIFNSDAHLNDATGNAYSGTLTPILDFGSGNVY